jgi:hypothetical protein
MYRRWYIPGELWCIPCYISLVYSMTYTSFMICLYHGIYLRWCILLFLWYTPRLWGNLARAFQMLAVIWNLGTPWYHKTLYDIMYLCMISLNNMTMISCYMLSFDWYHQCISHESHISSLMMSYVHDKLLLHMYDIIYICIYIWYYIIILDYHALLDDIMCHLISWRLSCCASGLLFVRVIAVAFSIGSTPRGLQCCPSIRFGHDCTIIVETHALPEIWNLIGCTWVGRTTLHCPSGPGGPAQCHCNLSRRAVEAIP